MQLRYHQEAFEILGETPTRSPEALALIRDWERRHDQRMPASVREWYSLQGADTRLTAPEIEYLQEPLAEALVSTEEEELCEHFGRTDLLPCMFALCIRGEVCFYVCLHGDDDPQVFDSVDPDRVDESFSGFVLGVVEDIVEQR